MASNLPKAGYQLVVHDADDSKVQKAAKEWPNTTPANGKAEAFADCEVIITMLPQGKVVREVLLGKDHFARSLKPGMVYDSLRVDEADVSSGTIIVDTSSSSPFDTRALGEELAQHSLQLIDSPITQTYMQFVSRSFGH